VKIFLDDERVPVKDGWFVVRDFFSFLEALKAGGELITEISFDHDLGWDKDRPKRSGKDCVNALIDLVLDHPDFLRGIERVWFHSANVEGADDMRKTLKNAMEHGVIHEFELITYSCLFHSDHAVMPRNFNHEQRDDQ